MYQEDVLKLVETRCAAASEADLLESLAEVEGVEEHAQLAEIIQKELDKRKQ